ncbi:MAG: hypothetical protein FJX74_20975, partial [Armatimonadetes bacterium]|nr:hypothetical protein [Armatimonadota bacterium]
MPEVTRFCDGLCRPALSVQPGQLLGAVCARGGLECPLLPPEEARPLLDRLASDPTAAIRLLSDADEVPHHTAFAPASAPAVLNRKRDLDVLQRLGLMPGDTRRARYLYELLFSRIETPNGICAHDTPGWEGCPHARSGVYERVRAQGWQAMVHARTPEEMAES